MLRVYDVVYMTARWNIDIVAMVSALLRERLDV